jgi:site-specific DNA-cytosine methylase
VYICIRQDDAKPAVPFLHVNIGRQWSQLLVGHRRRLRGNLAKLKSKIGHVFLVASLLSGTDVQFDVWKQLFSIISRVFGLPIEPRIVFACGNITWKQEVLQSKGVTVIFPCVHAMASSPDSVADTTGRDWSIPSVHFLIFAIECDSISTLSTGWSDRLDCVQEAALPQGSTTRTGSSAVSALAVVRYVKPLMWFAECTPKLFAKGISGKSGYDVILEISAKDGYFVEAHQLDAHEFGAPEQRDRAYLRAWYVGVEEAGAKLIEVTTSKPKTVSDYDDVNHLPNDEDMNDFKHTTTLASDVLQELAIPPLPLENYLFANDHSLVQELMDHTRAPKANANSKTKGKAKGKAKSRNTSAESKVMKHEDDHLDAYTHAKLVWPPTFTDEFVRKTKCIGNSQRMCEILNLGEASTSAAEATRGLYVRDLNLSLSWGRWVHEKTNCIVSSSVPWVRGTTTHGMISSTIDRKMLGEECLSLQGLSYELQTDFIRNLDWAKKMDLAGNMFSAETFCAYLLSALVAVPLGECADLLGKDCHSDGVQADQAQEGDENQETEMDVTCCSSDDEEGEEEEDEEGEEDEVQSPENVVELIDDSLDLFAFE